MGLSLRNLGSRIFDQVNPFDDGRTFKQRETDTVKRNRLYSEQRQRDLVLSNQVKNGQISKQQFNQGLKNSEQQSIIRPSTIQRANLSLANAASNNRIVNPILGSAAQWNPINKAGDVAFLAGSSLNQLGFNNGFSRALQQGGSNLTTYTDNLLRDEFAPKNNLFDKLTRGGVGLVDQLSTAAVNPVLSASLIGAQSFGNQYRNTKSAGGSDTEAFVSSAILGGGEAILEKLGLDKITGGAGSKVLTRIIKSMITEGSTEALQQILENKVAQETYDPKRNLFDGVKDAAIVGGTLGGAATGAISSYQAATTKGTQTQQTKITEKSETPRDIANRAEQAIGIKQTSLEQSGGKKRGFYNNIVDKVSNVANTTVGNLSTSKYKSARATSQILRAVSREFGVTQADRKVTTRLHGSVDYARELAGIAKETANDMIGSSVESANKVWATLDPELASTIGVDSNQKLTTAEQNYSNYIKSISDFTNDLAFETGMINKKTHDANSGGKYLARQYSAFDTKTKSVDNIGIGELQLEESGAIHRQALKDIKQEIKETAIKDPGYLMAVRLSEVVKNAEIHKFTTEISTRKDLVSKVQKPGYIKMPINKSWGELSGKFMKRIVAEDIIGFKYQSELGNSLYTAISWYNRLPIRKGRKKLLTTLNPSTRVVNRVSNSAWFAPLGGIDPVSHALKLPKAAKEINNKGTLYRALIREGVLGTDLTRSDIVSQKNRLSVLADKHFSTKVADSVKDLVDKADRTYGKADDEAKMAAYMVYKDRGMSHADAVQSTKSHFQNYRSVGWLFDISSKVPLMGNAFAKFAGDFLRLGTTGAVRHPMSTIALITAAKALSDLTSAASGESEEERKLREDRAFSRTIPFTNISTEVNTPIGAVDFSKFMGMFSLNEPKEQEIAGNQIVNDALDFWPGPLPVRRDKSTGNIEFNKQSLASDPLTGPVVQLALDEDFKQDPIQDPQSAKFPNDPLSGSEKIKNAATFAGFQYAGPFVSAVENIRRAAKGEESLYGSDLNVKEAASRLTGTRVKDFNAEQQKGFNTYFETERVKRAELNKLSTEERSAYDQIHPNRKARDGGYLEPENGVDIDPQIKADNYIRYPKLFEIDQKAAFAENAADGKPIDPIFRLDPGTRQTVLTFRGFKKGTGGEDKAMVYELPWFDSFKASESKYFDKLDKYYKDKGITSERKTPKDPYPANEDAIALQTQFFNLPEGTGDRSNFLNLHPELLAYWDTTREWKNRRRAELGLPPLESPSSKYGSGGSGSGSGSRKKKLSLHSTAQGRFRINPGKKFQGSVKAKLPSSSKVSIKSTTKAPKVSIKKSKV